MPDTLAHCAALERRYDGPVPAPERLAARLGSAAAVERLAAAGNAAFYRALVRGQIATLRRRRAEGSAYPALAGDLRFYRDRWRLWRRRTLAADASPPTGGRVPP